MVVHKRKKVTKYRGKGSGTHGCGARKKRRGAGSRGGKGRAGTGKRAGHKKNFFEVTIGREKGFKLHRKSVKAINVGDLERLASKQNTGSGHITLNLRELGYSKLLGAGSINRKITVYVAGYSAKAEEKIKAAGGEVISVEPAKAEKGSVE
ncbi:MAG TPA: uL15m family ribosomal protein [Candidatus Nanoarchaeia archaeon]|nr:uL15m family ribosomal protein [Candidatus Nanoarchaeia archaeon]